MGVYAFPMWRVMCAYVSSREDGMCMFVQMCPTERMACARVCVSYVEGGVCVCVLPRGWHVGLCVFPMFRKFMNSLALMWHTLNRYLTGEETWFQVSY